MTDLGNVECTNTASTQPAETVDDQSFTEDTINYWGVLESLTPNIRSEYLTKNIIQIGRCNTNDIIIPDLRISKLHCTIFCAIGETQGNNVYLKDERFFIFNSHYYFLFYFFA